MHKVLEGICSELDQLVAAMASQIPNDEPFNVAHGNWSFPGLTKSELIGSVEELAELIRERGQDALGAAEKRLADYPRRLAFLRANTPQQIWGSPQAAVPTLLMTLDGLRRAVEPTFKPPAADEVMQALKRLQTRIRGMEAQAAELEPRASGLKAMVDRIENAHSAADQLPTDLQSLVESRQSVDRLLREVQDDRVAVTAAKKQSEQYTATLKEHDEAAKEVVARVEQAYSAATSQGLAAAFAARSKSLDNSMWAWVLGLVLALGLGAWSGTSHISDLMSLSSKPDVPTSAFTLNSVLAFVSVGAPVWFAWLATKQIGERFRLSEDYAFKASVSKAYEGYRREAARVDEELAIKLLGSALSRLDELPLRLIDPASHGSPWHELASSSIVRDAMKLGPEFAQGVKELAAKTVDKMKTTSVTKGDDAT